MPYIKQGVRGFLNAQDFVQPDNAGELNYVFTMLAHSYWFTHGKNYQAFNDILGALEGCKLELYRRKVAPYEDGAIEENGDV
jgi:hypothetical protein